MGCLHSRRGYSESQSVQVYASIEILWETLTDIDAMPDYFSHIEHLERPGDAGTPVQVGTRWKEIRSYEGERFDIRYTITEMSRDPLQLRIASDMLEGCLRINTQASFSFTLLPAGDNDQENDVENGDGDAPSCELVGSYGYHFNGFLGGLKDLFCNSRVLRTGRVFLEDELADAKAEAERRHEQQQFRSRDDVKEVETSR